MLIEEKNEHFCELLAFYPPRWRPDDKNFLIPNSKENQKARRMDKLQLYMWASVNKVDFRRGSTNQSLRLRFPPWFSNTSSSAYVWNVSGASRISTVVRSIRSMVWFSNDTLHPFKEKKKDWIT